MSMHGVPQGVLNPPRRSAENAEEERLAPGRFGPAPGTLILVFVFLATFAVYYFTNWKLLSFVWQVG